MSTPPSPPPPLPTPRSTSLTVRIHESGNLRTDFPSRIFDSFEPSDWWRHWRIGARCPPRRTVGTLLSPPPFPFPPHSLDGPIKIEFEFAFKPFAFWSFPDQLLVVAIGRTSLSESYEPEEATGKMFRASPGVPVTGGYSPWSVSAV